MSDEIEELKRLADQEKRICDNYDAWIKEYERLLNEHNEKHRDLVDRIDYLERQARKPKTVDDVRAWLPSRMKAIAHSSVGAYDEEEVFNQGYNAAIDDVIAHIDGGGGWR